MMKKQFLALLSLPFLILSGAPALAADTEQAPRRWLDTKNYKPGPAVYGWSYRARPADYARASCGVYRYWDGKQCVDARETPPQY
jgi:hypothetical protein